MYAVIRTGGKQYRVTAGDILEVEKLDGSVGDTITLDDILMVSNDDDVTVGQPVVDGASITAKITGQYRGKKIMVFRYRPKKRIRVRKGHRQYLTRLEIESITANGETYSRPVSEKAAIQEEPAETTPIDETFAAAGAEEASMPETSMQETSGEESKVVVVEGPVAMVQTEDGEAELPPEVTETTAAAQDAGVAEPEEPSEGSNSENADSDKEDKE